MCFYCYNNFVEARISTESISMEDVHEGKQRKFVVENNVKET